MARATYVLVNGELVTKSVDGVITEEYSKLHTPKNPYAGYGSDSLSGGVNGILNHADGKRYDSKSQYNRAVVASGCRVVGNDFNNQNLSRTEVRGDFNVRPELAKTVHQVLNRGQ